MKQRTKAPIRKLTAAAGGGLALGTPLGTLAVYFIEQAQGHPLPVAVAGAVAAVIATLVATLVGYLTPPSGADIPVVG